MKTGRKKMKRRRKEAKRGTNMVEGGRSRQRQKRREKVEGRPVAKD